MLRRLFKDLQQSIERRVAEHVHLVDDIHALAHAGGGKHRLIAQGAHIVDAVVGRGVKLDHVEDRPVVDAAAGGALVARIAVDGCSQLTALARILAQVVLPVPRVPMNR